MIPYSYNMVDMGGIDLVEVNGTVVPGIYEKIYDATNDCGDVVLYNWKFAGIDITPQYTQILVGDPIVINGVIQVTELDQITIVGVGPEPPEPPTPVVLVPLVATENGTYDPADYQADGFSSVEVEVESPVVIRNASRIITTSIGGNDASVSVQEGTFDGLIFTPTGEAVNVVYTEVRTTPRVFDLVSLSYPTGWVLSAVVPVVSNGTLYDTGDRISTWSYNQYVDLIVIEST